MCRTAALKITVFLAFGLMSIPVAAEPVEIGIREVIVYPNQAQITRIGRYELPPGEHSLEIEHLPLKAIDDSFRVSVSEAVGLKLLGFNQKRQRHLVSTQAGVAELVKQIEEITRNELQVLENRRETYQEQKNLVLHLSRSAGKSGSAEDQDYSVDITQWQTAFDFVGQNLNRINDSLRTVNNQIGDVNRRLNKLREDLRSIQATKSEETKTVVIDIDCSQSCAFDLELKYVVTDATWTPIYDARLQNDSSVQLTYYANIAQKTGEDWKDVNLVVSTAQPSRNLGPGTLAAWYLMTQPVSIAESRRMGSSQNIERAAVASNTVRIESIRPQAPAPAPDLDVADRGTTSSIGRDHFAVSFRPPGKKTIESGDQAERFLIDEWNLKSRTSYVCLPRNRPEAYRQAEITNQDDAPLVPGAVSVFSGADYLGKTVFGEFIAPGETFELPFGVENSIKVERTVINEQKKHGNGIFSKDKVVYERTIKIILTNNDKAQRTVRVEEALPISRDDRVKVEFGKIAPPYAFQNEKGRTVWNLNLEPGGQGVVLIPFKVEHSNDIAISGL